MLISSGSKGIALKFVTKIKTTSKPFLSENIKFSALTMYSSQFIGISSTSSKKSKITVQNTQFLNNQFLSTYLDLFADGLDPQVGLRIS